MIEIMMMKCYFPQHRAHNKNHSAVNNKVSTKAALANKYISILDFKMNCTTNKNN